MVFDFMRFVLVMDSLLKESSCWNGTASWESLKRGAKECGAMAPGRPLGSGLDPANGMR
jgi:hypothetical protein